MFQTKKGMGAGMGAGGKRKGHYKRTIILKQDVEIQSNKFTILVFDYN
jgi:hypothetical protein